MFLSFYFILFYPNRNFDFSAVNSALFTDPTNFTSNLFIKNRSHNTIHTFKNYFVTVFSVFSFQFQQNKFYLNGPLIPNMFLFQNLSINPLVCIEGQQYESSLKLKCFHHGAPTRMSEKATNGVIKS